MTHDCEYCDRSFETAQGLGQHVSMTHESNADYKDPEKLEKLYHGQGLTLTEVGDELGCAAPTVKEWMERFDIPTRSNSESKVHANQGNPPIFMLEDSKGYPVVVSSYNKEVKPIRIHRLIAIAEYGVDKVVRNDVHHKNGKKIDNRPENIELMTTAEHARLHSMENNCGIDVDADAIENVLEDSGVITT